MLLSKVRIENFKSIEDSTEFEIDEVTCLVGKNEAGKTAILEALYKLNPAETEKADFLEGEYPVRRLSTYRKRKERKPDNVLTTLWFLEDDDVSAVNEMIFPAVLNDREIVLQKGYDNLLVWNLSIDETQIVKEYIKGANFNAAEGSQTAKADSVRKLIGTLKNIESPSEKQAALLHQITSDFADGDPILLAENILLSRLPKFLYFANYHALPGKVSVDDIKQRKATNNLHFPDKIFLALLNMTSTGINEIEGIDQLDPLIREMEAVEASLTDEIKKYWSQNKHLKVRFVYAEARPADPPPLNTGYVFDVRIENTRHRATVNFGERSHGFIWFFSFLVWLSQVKEEYGDNLFILLDEPGLPLHGKAQQDLIRYINERLRPDHQVVYTAHSPFLIDGDNIFSLRTVEDVVSISIVEGEEIENIEGTKVGQRILSRDEDTIFPLQGVLGFDLAQTLFVGPNVVVVEGPTERAVIDWFSRELIKRGREGLDIRWAVCPADGASKISSFVTLFSGRGMKIAVLADYHEGQKKKIDRLAESGLLPEDHVLRTSDFTEEDESDIEDVVGREMYIVLVDGAMELSGKHSFPKTKPVDASIRVVKEAEAHCRRLPLGYPEFSHYSPIEYLLSQPDGEIDELPGLDDALDRFERIFTRLNSFLVTEMEQSQAEHHIGPATETRDEPL